MAHWRRMARRLLKPRTLDLETAVWEIFHLIVNPKKMYRTNYTYKQQNNGSASYTRDDPSFLILLSILLTISAVAWGVAYSPHISEIVQLVFGMVVFDFYIVGVCFATVLWVIANLLFNPQFSLTSAFLALARYNINYIDWGFCFDVHCNAFLIVWCLLYLLQFILLPLITHNLILLCLLGNSLYFGAISRYFVITFYGFNSLPIMNSTHNRGGSAISAPGKTLQMVILAFVLPTLAVLWVLSIVFRFNVASHMINSYFD